MINFRIVFNIVGILVAVVGALMLLALPFSLYFESEDGTPILLAAATSILVGLFLWLFNRKADRNIGKREGYLIVSLGWLAVSMASALPYIYGHTFVGFADAIFEAISGLTTTGASAMTNIEIVPKGILFWRSLTQWIGGMGIIVLTVAIFPLLGIGGVELFVAEAPGPTSDKIHPRIKETAKRLWFIYFGLTILLTIILRVVGMDFYDAINHGLTTMATGGFSTKNASIAHYDSAAIQYPIIIFMFLAGINYTVIYYSLIGRFDKAWRSDELRAYLGIVLVLAAMVTLIVHQVTDLSWERAFRDSIFQIISVVTTTGFASSDFTAWTPMLTILFFAMLFLGASAGSTSGGIKIIRHLVFFKNAYLEFKRLLHPNALIGLKVDQHIVSGRIITHILVFLLIYLLLFGLGSLVMTYILADFNEPILTAVGATATALSNVGPGIAELGPSNNFSAVPTSGKLVLSFLMLLGRLELFTILVLFTPAFWKVN